jgi:hypothetical protein
LSEIREISKERDEFMKGVDGEVLGVCMDSDIEKARACAAELKPPFRSVFTGAGWDGAIPRAYGIRSIPAAMLVGPDGRILLRRAVVHDFVPPK